MMKLLISIVVLITLISCVDSSKSKNSSEETMIVGDSIDSQVILNKSIDSSKIKELKTFFIEKKDEFSTDNITWIQPKDQPEYRNMNGTYCYFAKSENYVGNFRFVFQYVNEDWLFIEKITFLIDEKPIDYYTGRMETDVNDGDISEWFDNPIKPTDEALIKAIANSKTVKMKLHGRQYSDIRNLSKKQINSIKRTYEYYIALGGEFN